MSRFMHRGRMHLRRSAVLLLALTYFVVLRNHVIDMPCFGLVNSGVPPPYRQLSQTCLGPGFDLTVLRDELLADSWTEETLPIMLLSRDGATKVDIDDWTKTGTRTVSYKLPVLPGGIGARVENTYTVHTGSDDTLSLEILSVTYAPVIENMRVHTYYKLSKENGELTLQLAGHVAWTKSPPKVFAAPIERGIQKSQTASGEGFIEALGKHLR
eukprot:TRINITY_DN55204_c0_g1_i1.p1 TRINITY_DN55204_c0_g1~~TRINITY_DN55204_c0_g1_i1.p1  ORF type:complete len:223 (+),score=20.20 TRINITY_DN55204_c0_g1_i1:33-671(+)